MYFEKYEFSLALQSIEQFFFKDFCDNYLELIKGYFFNPEKYDPITINEIKKIASSLFYNIISLFSTFIPFITEYIYREIYDNNDFLSLHHIEKFSYSLIEHNFEPILDLVGHIRKEKTNAKISLKGKIKILYIESKDEKLKNIIEANENLIKSNFNIDFVVYDSSKILMNESISIINNEVEYIIYKK